MKNIVFVYSLAFIQLFGQDFRQSNNQWIVMLDAGSTPEDLIREIPMEYRPYISRKSTISYRFNLYVLEINARLDMATCEALFLQCNTIRIAQPNHRVTLRAQEMTEPNDLLYYKQWHLNNTDSTLGVADADIDAPEAWNISTGGVSALGDTIVVAVIDEGFDIGHPDINWWKNKGEIPGNGIDDDQNGYIDDYDGWDATTGDGVIPNETHGTHVAGIIGAKGNNSSGVAGIGWQVKILPVVGIGGGIFGDTEAGVVAAYSYIYEQRKLYDETRGKKGAFIVAANSSFGVDEAFPEDFPIWCAMFDTLGKVGILSTVATTNNATNVDLLGDIPSNCPSPFIIATTATNRFDAKPTRESGFGQKTIDLGAPGFDILSTISGGTYGSRSGTSFSSPQVAGVLGLMYSAACANQSARYYNQPDSVALEMRELLLMGVDNIDTLQNLVASGGRLNASNSLLLLQADCANFSDCPIPYAIQLSNLSDTMATLSWEATNSDNTYLLRYRSEASWTYVTTRERSFDLSLLSSCTDYSIQLAVICKEDTGTFSAPFRFRTKGCCEPPRLLESTYLQEDGYRFTWNSVFGAQAYTFSYTLLGTAADSPTISKELTDTVFQVASLLPCSRYEIRISSRCKDTLPTDFFIDTLSTKGCGICIDGAYCEANIAALGSPAEWLQSIQIGNTEINSGNISGGYHFNTASGLQLKPDTTYTIQLKPGYKSQVYSEAWSIWLDLNQDGQFDETGENIYSTNRGVRETVTDSFMIPPTALPGETRMRVAMRFISKAPVCGTIVNGDVEDYCVTILSEPTGISQIENTLLLYPVPATTTLFVQAKEVMDQYRVLDLNGRNIGEWRQIKTTQTRLPLASLSAGMYILEIKWIDGKRSLHKIVKR